MNSSDLLIPQRGRPQPVVGGASAAPVSRRRKRPRAVTPTRANAPAVGLAATNRNRGSTHPTRFLPSDNLVARTKRFERVVQGVTMSRKQRTSVNLDRQGKQNGKTG